MGLGECVHVCGGVDDGVCVCVRVCVCVILACMCGVRARMGLDGLHDRQAPTLLVGPVVFEDLVRVLVWVRVGRK